MWDGADKSGECWTVGEGPHYPRVWYAFEKYIYGHRLAWTATLGTSQVNRIVNGKAWVAA
jgi:hypothetical protein